ncbi:hypothetical protein FACS1894181_06630 [Bacteroidia bacterium]|nr:hypothetical protein FACS1894181_06630 [Bacteroidia bacterium]
MFKKSIEKLLEDLHGSIYYNPLIQDYEVSDKFIVSNVIEKAERVEKYIESHPQDFPAAESLKALKNLSSG